MVSTPDRSSIRVQQLDLNVRRISVPAARPSAGSGPVQRAEWKCDLCRNNATASTPGGASSLGQVTSILQGRIMRLAFQMRF
jgi:hypothetical protein